MFCVSVALSPDFSFTETGSLIGKRAALCMSGYRNRSILLRAPSGAADLCDTVTPPCVSAAIAGMPVSANRPLFDITRQLTPRNQESKVTEVIELVGVKPLEIMQLQGFRRASSGSQINRRWARSAGFGGIVAIPRAIKIKKSSPATPC